MKIWDTEYEDYCEIYIRVLCPECDTTEEQLVIGNLGAFDDTQEIAERIESDLQQRGWRSVNGKPMCPQCQARHDDGLEADYRRDLYEERRLEEE